VGHACTQLPLLQALPLPHWPSLQHCWQTPLQRNSEPLHFRSHLAPSQVAVALGEVGQELHDDVPQESTLRLSLHSSPQRCEPDWQLKPQVVPLQVAWPLAGGWQGMHEEPQLAVSVLETQLSLQLCVPAGHVPPQGLTSSRQTPLQSLVLAGHVVPH
jgi:hypothetical protein